MRSVALWLTPSPPAQRRGVVTRGDVRVKVTQVVLGEVDAEALLRDPTTACFAAGADARGMSDDALCGRVVAALVASGASWYQRHMAVITAPSKGRYEAMKRRMSAAGFEPVIIEDFVYFGEDRGMLKATANSVLKVASVRGLVFSEAQREKVLACTDLATLEDWLGRAAIVASAEEVLRDAA